MKKMTFVFAFLLAVSWQSQAQLFISENFDSGVPSSWSGDYSTSSINACEGESARDNLYSSSDEGELVTPNFTGISNGTDLTVSLDYKILDWGSGNPATPAGWGEAQLQYSTDDGTTWNTFYTVDDSNHVVSTDCATITATVPAASLPAGSDIKLRVFVSWTAGDYYFYIDNFETAQVIDCTFPEASTEVVEDCVNGTYTINIDVTSLGDATSLTITNDLGAPDMLVTETGVVSFGPVPVGTVVNLALEHDGDSDCNLDLGTFKDTCPPINDECSGAISLDVNPDLNNALTTSGSIEGASDSGVDNCSGTADDDVWYSFVATSESHQVNLINVTGSTTDLYHAVYDAAPGCGNLTSALTCSDPNSSLTSGLTVGNTYYVQVYTWTSTSGQTTSFDISVATPPTQSPVNDECEDAIALTVNSDMNCTNSTAGTTVNATESPQLEDDGDITGTPNNDVWFTFEATSTLHVIELQNVTAVFGSSTDMGMAVYDATGGCMALGAPIQDSDPNSMTVNGLTAGTTYSLRVYGWSSNANYTAQTTFDVCVLTPPPPPANDDCSGALPLVVTSDETNVTTFNLTSVTESPEELVSCDSSGNYGVWYEFTAPTPNLEFISGTESPGMIIFEGTDCNDLTPIDSTCLNNVSGTVSGLTVNETYYLMVWNDTEDTVDADFVLYYESCADPIDLDVQNVSDTTADLIWTAAGTESEWEVVWGEAGFDPLTEGTTVADNDGTLGVSLSGLTAETDYEYYVTAVCSTSETSGQSGPFAFTTTPACAAPTDILVSQITESTADFSWTVSLTEELGYDWVVMTEGEDPEIDTPVESGTTNPGDVAVTVTGLTAATAYDFYIQTDCDANGLSDYAGPVSFSTLCDATNVPFVQDFESVTTPELPNCGTIETIAGNDWQTHNQTSYGFDSNVLRYRYSTSSAADAWYFTRGINLVAGENYQISYQYGNNSTTYTENLKVAYGTSASAASMTEDIDDHTISLSGSEVNEVTFTVPTDGVYYFGFQAYSDVNEYYLYVDDIQIDLAPACIKPSNLIASNVNGNSFDLDWNAISTETDGYEWFIMASGENPDVDTPIQTGTTGTGVTTVSITGLSETTTYDVYVRTDCGVEGMSDYSDALTVETTVTCAAPTDLALNETNVTSTSAEFTWTASASEELGYDWVVMTEGEDPAVDTPVETGTTASGETSVTINNLSPATAYDFYIQADCDANGLSDYAGPVSFSTLCDATNVPFVQDFESVTTPELPNCGTIETIAGNDWQTHNQTSYGFDSNVLRYRYSTSSAADAWYFTRGINLVAGENYQISYQYGNNSTTYTENLKVAFGTSADAASMTENIDDHTISLSGSEVNEVTFTVPADGVYYFGFQAYSDVNEYYLYVDNIEIDIAPTCIAPANVAVSNITTDSADFAWDAEASEVNGYEWYLMAAGEEPEVDTPVQTGTTATGETSVTLTGLTPTTSYDFYVRTDCDTEGMSAFSSTLNFETMLGAVIVTPGTTESGTYCYENNDFKEWWFESSDGSPLTIEFIQGTLEFSTYSGQTYDDLMIYDGSDDTGTVLYDSNVDTVDGELAGTIITAQSGMMYITLDADGSGSCGSGSETEIIFNVDADVTTGNQDFFSDANFTYYPNPVQSSFEINSTYELEQVVIYNMLGQEVRNISPQSTDVSLDLSDVQAGVYLVKATVKGQTQTFRLIKE